jgi:hypothetical protein
MLEATIPRASHAPGTPSHSSSGTLSRGLRSRSRLVTLISLASHRGDSITVRFQTTIVNGIENTAALRGSIVTILTSSDLWFWLRVHLNVVLRIEILDSAKDEERVLE